MYFYSSQYSIVYTCSEDGQVQILFCLETKLLITGISIGLDIPAV